MSERPAFDLLARPIQRILWDMQWRDLRPLQEEAIRRFFGEESDLLISAQTAAGKTEAAFLPVLSQLFTEPADSVQAMYVGPLKALINDQFRRLERLCERAEIPVHRWHGDVSASQKKLLLKRPSGVLLITPESIESLFINRKNQLPNLFRSLQYVVIDEIHALVGSERGTHLRSLLFRLQRHAAETFRMIGLSATLGDSFPQYENWLRPDRDRAVKLIRGPSGEKRLMFKIHGYRADLAPPKSRRPEEQRPAEDEEQEFHRAIADDIFKHFVGKRNLVFANNKTDVELYCHLLNERCRLENRPEEFLIHHGSLSKEIREFTEQQMQGDRPRTTVCSSTLELGIDIGSVAAVGHIDSPFTVNSQVQRLGRSGRGDGEPQCMRVYVRQRKVPATDPVIDRVYPDLLRAIALTELMLQEPQWVEPPQIDQLDLSTLTHQILSVLAETGGCHAGEIFDRLCGRGAFRAVDRGLFAGVLRSLGAKGIVEQMDGGDLLLAPDGEAIVEHYSFYAAFQSGLEYSLIQGGEVLGKLPSGIFDMPEVSDHILFAGRRWQIQEIVHERREILVRPAKGKKLPRFSSGSMEIHARVVAKMRDALISTTQYRYLNEMGSQMLQEARGIALQTGLEKTSFVSRSGGKCTWFPWTGTKIFNTLKLLAERIGLNPTPDFHRLTLDFDVGVDFVRERWKTLRLADIDARELARKSGGLRRGKFDDLVAEPLLAKAIAHDYLDVQGAVCVLRQEGLLPGD
ncbi:DEAD/DEAH box helicase [Blastopirellula retiformator]|uniref:Putative ATP-dependent helicase Lhr n=1 Tax=Blastopirellula retiformator TaxID=2527970 RepID=A0A5C5V1C2_9BACT|nr:DEAD/DEAH box helicase [Blastopirellula retiformator]TWT31793.1 putative ATP-dependent helicase Lhr [Blastopirellula retiformator]